MSMSNFFGLDDDLQKKKDLLQREIINKNYNRVQFVDYCSSRKENGDDLQNWTLSELESVINDFVKLHQDPNTNNINITQNQIKDITLDSFDYNKPNNATITKEIQCRKIEPSVLSNKDIKVEVKNPKVNNSNSFLSSNYITYDVITPETNWSVSRRFSDFYWLRETLKKFFPRIYVPPMAKKKIGGRRFEEDYVLKRMHLLNVFINECMQNELFKASEPIVSFLSIIDRTQFEFKMKELSSYIPSEYIEEMRTLDGKVKLTEDTKAENLNKNISLYFQLQNKLIANVTYNMSNFYSNMEAAVCNLQEIDKDFDTLKLLNNKVLNKEQIINNYSELSKFIKSWKKIMFNQKEIFNKRIKVFFKHIQMEGEAYSELITSWSELKSKFESERQKLQTKKEKLWATMDISKWEIMEDFAKIDRLLLFRDKVYAFAKMCTKDTQRVQGLYNQLNYANWVNNEQLKILINKQSDDMVKNTQKFAEEIQPTLSDMLDTWGKLNSIIN